MKGFKNAFAAGAIGIILAVTGCQQFAPTETVEQATRSNRGVVTQGYRSRNLNRNTGNALTNRAKRVNTGNINNRQATKGTANRYGSSAVTTNRSRNLIKGNTSGSGLVNTNMYGQKATRTRINPTINNRQNMTRDSLSIGTRNANAVNRTTNTTGSPFGDYNKDRAYTGSSTRNLTGESNLNAGSAQINNATTIGNTNVGNTVVRKNFTEGSGQTRTASGTAKKSNSVRSAKALTNTKTGNATTKAAKETESKKTTAVSGHEATKAAATKNTAKTRRTRTAETPANTGGIGANTIDLSKARVATDYNGTVKDSISYRDVPLNARMRSSVNNGIRSGNRRTVNNTATVNNAGVNNMNNRYSGINRTRNTNDLVYNNTIFNDDMLYNFDNMTIGGTYRNADLRNDYYSLNTIR